MTDKYIVVIKWDAYETSEVLFEKYDEAKAYYNAFEGSGEAQYLAKILEGDDSE